MSIASYYSLGDRRTIYIYIQFAHGCTVYVGLAQACPNYYQAFSADLIIDKFH